MTMNTTPQCNTTVVISKTTQDQKVRNAAAARARYALRTDAEKDADRERKKVEAHARVARRTDAQKDAVKARDRARYTLRTEEVIEHDKARHRERYHRTHPYSRVNKENERIAANKRIEDAVKKANSIKE